MASAAPVQALQQLVASRPQGEAVERMQEPLYVRFGLKLSYRTIETILMGNPDLFAQHEGLWTIKEER